MGPVKNSDFIVTMFQRLSIKLYMLWVRCINLMTNFNYPYFFFKRHIVEDLSFIWRDSYYHVGLSLESFSAKLHDRLFYEYFDMAPLPEPKFKLLRLLEHQQPHLSVHLAQDLRTQSLLVVRQYKLHQLIKYELVQSLVEERKLLFAVDFWCFGRTLAHYQDSFHYCFLQEHIQGLRLSELIADFHDGKGLPESWTCFISGQLLIAIEYLHKAHVLMRDIRPEHVLVAPNGYLKVTDLSQCIRLEFDQHSSTRLCGRLATLSPEYVYGECWTTASDWWMFGVLLYEMVVGKLPFMSHRGFICTLLRIMLNRRRLPIWLSFQLKDLINGTLHLNIQTRYTSNKITHHSWFKQIDFGALVRRQQPPPAVHRVLYDSVWKNRIKFQQQT